MKKNKLLESVFSNRLLAFLHKQWSRPVERNFVALVAKHKDEIVEQGEEGKQYLKDLLDENQMMLEDSCTDEFLEELTRLSTEYQTDDSMGNNDLPSSPEMGSNENLDDKKNDNKVMPKIKEATEKPIKIKGEKPPKIKLKVDIFNHDASDEDIEKDGSCLVKSGASLTWDDVQKAYKSGEKLVRSGLLHPSMYDVVGEDNKLSDKLPTLKKEAVNYSPNKQKDPIYDNLMRKGIFFSYNENEGMGYFMNIDNNTPLARYRPQGFLAKVVGKKYGVFDKFQTWGKVVVEKLLGDKGIEFKDKGNEIIISIENSRSLIGGLIKYLNDRTINRDHSKPYPQMKESVYDANEKQKQIQKETKPLDSTPGFNSKTKKTWDVNGSSMSESEQLTEKLEWENTSAKIHLLKGISIPMDQLKQIVLILRDTYGARPKIKSSKDAVSELKVDTFPISQMVNLRQDLKTINPNLEVDPITIPNVNNAVETMDESRAENMTRNGRIRAFEDDDLSDVNKIIEETENELVNFHKDKTQVVDSWKDIQNKTPTSNTVIEEDVKGLWPKEPQADTSKGKWKIKFDTKKIKGKQLNVVYTTFTSTDGIKYTGGAIVHGVSEMAKISAIKNAKVLAQSKASKEEPVLEAYAAQKKQSKEIDKKVEKANKTDDSKLRKRQSDAYYAKLRKKNHENKTKDTITEDPERGKQMGNTKADIVDPFEDIFNITPSSKTIIEEEEETVNIHTDHVDEVDPWEEYGIKSEWIEEAFESENAGFVPIKGKKYDIKVWIAPDIGEKVDPDYLQPANETIDGEEGWYWSLGVKYLGEKGDEYVFSDNETFGEKEYLGKSDLKNSIRNAGYHYREFEGDDDPWPDEEVMNETVTDMQHNFLDEGEEQIDPMAQNFLDKVRVSDNSIQLSELSVEGTPKGNWAVFKDGKHLMTIQGKYLDDATIQKYGLERHDNLEEGNENLLSVMESDIKKIKTEAKLHDEKFVSFNSAIYSYTEIARLYGLKTGQLKSAKVDRNGIKIKYINEYGGYGYGFLDAVRIKKFGKPGGLKESKAEFKTGTPEGGKKGIDDRVKEQEDKDESLEETEKEYCNYDEWEEKLKELYKGKSVKFEDELYATVAYVGDEEVGEWKEDTASGGTGKIWHSMFDELELINEDYNITGVTGGFEHGIQEDEELEESEVILHEDMTTADMAVPDKPIGGEPLQKRKIEEIDRFFSEFVQKNCDVRGFMNEGKFDIKGYMNSRPYSLQSRIIEAFEKELEESEDMLPEVGNEEEIHDHLRINENDGMENYNLALEKIKKGIVQVEKSHGGIDANGVGKIIEHVAKEFGLSEDEIQTIRGKIFDWRNKRG